MTFNIPINVDSIVIENNNITLTNIVCYNNAPSVSSVFWNTANTNKDSTAYCVPSTYVQATNELCPKVYSGFGSFGFSFLATIAILGVLIILTLVAGVVYFVRNEADMNMGSLMSVEWGSLIYVVIGLAVIVIVLVFAVFAVSIPCSFNI